MKKFLLFVFFLSTLLTPALAQPAPTGASGDADPTQMTGEQRLAYCEAKWGSRISTVAQCVTDLRLAASESRDGQIVARLDEGEERDEALLESIDEIGNKVDRLAPQAVATSAPTSGGVSYTRTGGAAWAPVSEPFVVSIYNIEVKAVDTLHITNLDHPTARKTCGGEGAALVVFYDHGYPTTLKNVYPDDGRPTGFIEVYYDRDNDGTPDGTVMALDLATQTDVWVTWGLQNDLTVRYLRPGYQVDIAGLPRQTVYHPTQRNEASASGAIGCKRWDGARRGGHQAIPAYSLSRMW